MKELKVGLIGGGFMGKAHSMAYAVAPLAEDLGAVVIRQVVVDTNPDVARASAAQLGWAEHATDWREVVSREDIDIVDICTPPQFHQEIALAALAAGKHVFCEKPITNTADEAETMAAAAQASGLVAQVGFNYRHTPAIAFTKQLLDAGKLGTPLQFRASYLQEVGFGWSAQPDRWRARKSTGGSGTLGDIGSHVIDLGEYLLGDIVRVCGLLRSKGQGAEEGWLPEHERLDQDLIDDGAVWIAQFASGAIGTFAAHSYASGRKNRVYFELDGTKGATQFDWNSKEEFQVSYVDEPADHQGFRRIHTSSQHPDGFWKLAGLGLGYVEVSAIQFQKFVRAIVGGSGSAPSFTDAAHVQRVVDAVTESARTGEWVEVKPRSEATA